MKFGLVMCVKNEAERLPRLAESVAPHLSHYTIVDTGSTDGTAALARKLFKGIEGSVVKRKWVNYGHNKTEALALAKGTAPWLLVLDADMTVDVTAKPGPMPRAAALLINIVDATDFAYRLPLVVSSKIDWRYEGVTHEYLTSDKKATRQMWDGLTVTHHQDGARRPTKLADDLALLRGELARNPGDDRTVFYLAQTFMEMGDVDNAISYYRMRAEMGGWDEEKFYARYQLGCLLVAHRDFLTGADELLRAWRERPARVEPLRALANAANNVADKRPIPEQDILFVHRDAYATPAPASGITRIS